MLFIINVLMVIFSTERLRYDLWYLLPFMVTLRRDLSFGQKTERKNAVPRLFSTLSLFLKIHLTIRYDSLNMFITD